MAHTRDARNRSANALSGFALIILLFGSIAMNTVTPFLGAALAAAMALLGLLIARKRSVLAFAAGVLAVSTVAAYQSYPRYRESDSVARLRITQTTDHLRRIEHGIEMACRDGRFPMLASVRDLGLDSDPPPLVRRATLDRVSLSRVEVRMELEELQTTTIFGLDPRIIVPAGALLQLDVRCEAAAFASRLQSSSLEPKYLPAKWR